MSLAGKIVKGTAIFSFSNVIVTVPQFLTSILVIRALGKLDYGRLVLALSVYSVGTIFLDLGLGKVISSEIARSRGEKRLDQVKRFLLRYSQMELGGGALLLIVPILASPWINKAYSPMIARLFIIMGAYLFLTGIKNLFGTTFYSYTLYHYLTFLQVTFALFRLLLVLLLVMWLKQGLMGAILTYPLSLAIAILLLSPFWWRVVSPLKKVKASKEPVFRKALKDQGTYVILMLPFKNIQDQLPVWMIKALLGTEMVAIYAVAQRGFSLLFFPSEFSGNNSSPLNFRENLYRLGNYKKDVEQGDEVRLLDCNVTCDRGMAFRSLIIPSTFFREVYGGCPCLSGISFCPFRLCFHAYSKAPILCFARSKISLLCLRNR